MALMTILVVIEEDLKDLTKEDMSKYCIAISKHIAKSLNVTSF